MNFGGASNKIVDFFWKNKSAIIFPFTYFSGHNSSSIRVFSSRSNVTKKPWPVLRSHFSKITHSM